MNESEGVSATIDGLEAEVSRLYVAMIHKSIELDRAKEELTLADQKLRQYVELQVKKNMGYT